VATLNRLELRDATRARLVIETHSGRQALESERDGLTACSPSVRCAQVRVEESSPDARDSYAVEFQGCS